MRRAGPLRRAFLPDAEATMRAGRRLAEALRATGSETRRGLNSVHLSGPLGAGKTTLVRGLVRGLGHAGPVKSPTYTLVEPYELEDLDVYHFDLYRLAAPRELDDFGARDYFREGALCVVEWPERGEGVLPSADLALGLRIRCGGRLLCASAASREGRELLGGWRLPLL